MKLKISSAIVLMTAIGPLSACSTVSSRFEWGGYEGALYAYSKTPDKRPQYIAALEMAVKRGRTADKVAPGLLAELGYLYLEDGDTAHAVPLFEEEMTRFPESRAFLSAVVARAKGAATQPALEDSPEVKS